jgi:tetratricopeptide (TPR) repeat protein
MGNYPDAIEGYWKSARIYEELSVADPSNPDHHRNEVLTYKYLATLLELTGDVQGSLDLSRKAVAADQRLVDLDPLNAGAKLDLSFSYSMLAKSLMATGDLSGAVDHARKGVEISLAAYEADPKNAFARSAVGKAYRSLGEIARHRGDLGVALENDRKAVETYQALAASDPENGWTRSSEAGSYSQLGEVYMDMASKARSQGEQADDWRTARSWLKQSYDAWTNLKQRGPLTGLYQKEPERVAGEMARCDAALSALDRR